MTVPAIEPESLDLIPCKLMGKRELTPAGCPLTTTPTVHTAYAGHPYTHKIKGNHCLVVNALATLDLHTKGLFIQELLTKCQISMSRFQQHCQNSQAETQMTWISW